MFRKIIKQLVEDLTHGLEHDVEAYANRILQRMLRSLVLGGVGVTFLAAGSVFLLIGIVAYLSTFMFNGLAWGIVGLVAALIGAMLLLLIRR